MSDQAMQGLLDSARANGGKLTLKEYKSWSPSAPPVFIDHTTPLVLAAHLCALGALRYAGHKLGFEPGVIEHFYETREAHRR
jgi:hypothetical protein